MSKAGSVSAGLAAGTGGVLLEGSVGDGTMEVDIQAELDEREHSCVQRLHRGEAVALLHCPAHVLHHRTREAPRDRG